MDSHEIHVKSVKSTDMELIGFHVKSIKSTQIHNEIHIEICIVIQ